MTVGSRLGNVGQWDRPVKSTKFMDAQTALFGVQYTRDSLGRISQKTETVEGVADTYAYDAAGRLTEVRQNGALTASYTYDANGNRVNRTTPSGTETRTYDAQDRLLTYGGATYSYTANGELATRTDATGTTTYTYDLAGNLTQITLPDGRQIGYLIDARNRRIGKTVNGVLVQGWLYRDGLKPVAELDGAGNLVARFVYGSSPLVPDYIVKGPATYRIISDHLGSPRLVVDTTTGAVVQRREYDEFGQVTLDTAPGFQPFGFAGGLDDRDTMLVRFGMRDYDARSGRWTSKDAMDFKAGDANLYGYVRNEPVNRVDPTGFAELRTDMTNGTTTFDPRPERPLGYPITIPTRNDVTRNAKPGATDPYTTVDINVVWDVDNNIAYGPDGAYINTGDPRGRDLHAGGTCKGPLGSQAPLQGWCPTFGCTRGQNADVQALAVIIEDFKRQHPGVKVPYTRYYTIDPTRIPWRRGRE